MEAVGVVGVPLVAPATLSVTSVGSSVISPVIAPVEHQVRVMVEGVVLVGMVVAGGGHSQIQPALLAGDLVGYLLILQLSPSNSQHRSHVTGLYTGPEVLQLCVVLYTSYHLLRL